MSANLDKRIDELKRAHLRAALAAARHDDPALVAGVRQQVQEQLVKEGFPTAAVEALLSREIDGVAPVAPDQALARRADLSPAVPETPVVPAASGGFEDREAQLHAQFDDAVAVGAEDPAAGLDQLLVLLQRVEGEMIKTTAPPLIESNRRRAATFAVHGRFVGPSKDELRAGQSLSHHGRAIVQLGFARAKLATLREPIAQPGEVRHED